MEKPQNVLDDLWILSTGVAVISYTLTTIFFLYFLSFDIEVTGNEKAGIVIFFALSVVLVYSYKQAQNKFRICGSIFEENENKAYPNIDSSLNCKTEAEEINTFHSLKILSQFFGKSYVRRFSFPVQSRGEFCYNCNRITLSKNEFAFESQLLHKTDPKISPSENSDGTCFKDSDDVPVLLHNCVKDLGDIIERVKLLNEVYTETREDVEDTKRNSKIAFQKINSDGEFVENEECHQSQLQSVSDNQKVTGSLEDTCSFKPVLFQDLDISKKLIQKRKIDSYNQFPESVGVNQSLSKNIHSNDRNFSEDNIQEPFSKSSIIDTEEVESFLAKIPLHYSEFYSVGNAESEQNMGKETTSLQFYEKKSPETQIAAPKASLKNHLPRIPMKPHMLSIPERQYVQANTRKRHVAIMSKKEPTISEYTLKNVRMSITSKNLPIIRRNGPIVSRNAPTMSRMTPTMSRKTPIISRNASMISKNKTIISNKGPVSEILPPVSAKGPISVDEILISIKNNFITDIKEHLVSIKNVLITKFDLLDILNFTDVFFYFVDFYGLYPDYNIDNDNEQ